MAWLSKQLSLESKKPLVSGFSRETYGLIPTDLIKIIRWYMDEVLYWSMEGRFLNKFCTKKTGQILYSSTYNYKDIEFCCYWYPNGNSLNYEDCVIFGVTLSKLPKYIESLTIYYRLECNVFNCLWKSVHTFSHNNDNGNCIGWNPFNMKLSKCKNKNKIDFNCYIHVLRIIYINGSGKKSIETIETLSECILPTLQITKYRWSISSAGILNELYKCELGKTFYSDNFGGNFIDNFGDKIENCENYCLFIAPKGFNQDKNVKIDNNTNHLMLYLRILRLPINIKTMNILYTIICKYTLLNKKNDQNYQKDIIHKIKEIKTCKVGYAYSECTKQILINKIPNILLLSSCQIDVKIQIQQIIDMNTKIIPKCHWEKYFVIKNDNFSKLKKLFI